MKQRVFVIRGFGSKKDSGGNLIDFDQVHRDLIAPALVRCELAGSTTAEVIDAGNIRADMFALILEADIVVCDITVHNANVFYELGIRHALRKKHTVLIKGDPSADNTPFDLSTDRYLKYDIRQPAAALDDLVQTLQASLRGIRSTDSPVFLMMPSLPEANPSDVTMVPMDFIEEVERAEAAGDKGLLRVIAEDLRGQRFQWDGLRHIARAQWNLKDYGGAQSSWETLREALGQDVEASLALSNLYERAERSSRKTGPDNLLEASDQALRQVLDDARASLVQRAEALGLQGRNLKTQWRARLTGATDPVAACQRALDARALQSYESYRAAFRFDLNAFYPGLAALQMARILLLLARLPGWRNLFKGNRDAAERKQKDLETDVTALTHVVAASIERARAQSPDAERLWADIADADLLFLSAADEDLQDDAALLVQAYRDAIPPKMRFAWDAAKGQLELFSQLGFRAAAAQAVIKAVESSIQPPDPTVTEHLVVFAGHRIDAQDAAVPRFPARAEALARQLIREHLQALQQALPDGEHLTVLASAAPGADILAHEVCMELGLSSRLCLPMPQDEVARLAFPDADQWRARFRTVVHARRTWTLQMSQAATLPRWLQGRPDLDLWDRGNRWVLQTANAWGAGRTTLLALWDGRDNGRTGGTAHMVRLARSLGHFDRVDIIDSRQLLA